VHADVPDVPGTAVHPAVQPALDHDPGPDTRPDGHQQQGRDGAPVGALLAERHEVRIVLHEHRYAQARGEPLPHRVVVPPGHHRRVHGSADRHVHRPGNTDPERHGVGRVDARLGDQGIELGLDLAQYRLGTVCDGDSVLAAVQHAPTEIQHGQLRPVAVQPDRQDVAEALVEGEGTGGPAAPLGLAGRLAQQAGRQEHVHPLRHGGAREPGRPDQLTPGGGSPAAHELQQQARRHGVPRLDPVRVRLRGTTPLHLAGIRPPDRRRPVSPSRRPR
jgi:hypothetical protein